ncbi:MAG: ferrous iron transport protein A [Thermoplasmata archaeon]|jgi:ferrous iron transport protein A|nr:ferrous iron transport protein A [Thermoplasmata archaeon]
MDSPQSPNTQHLAGGSAIPVSLMKRGEYGTVNKVSGKTDIRRFLEGLGFVPGAMVRIVKSDLSGHILEVKGSRIALDSSMATKIMVDQ